MLGLIIAYLGAYVWLYMAIYLVPSLRDSWQQSDL